MRQFNKWHALPTVEFFLIPIVYHVSRSGLACLCRIEALLFYECPVVCFRAIQKSPHDRRGRPCVCRARGRSGPSDPSGSSGPRGTGPTHSADARPASTGLCCLLSVNLTQLLRMHILSAIFTAAFTL